MAEDSESGGHEEEGALGLPILVILLAETSSLRTPYGHESQLIGINRTPVGPPKMTLGSSRHSVPFTVRPHQNLEKNDDEHG